MLIFGGKILISVPRPEPSPFSVRSDSPDEMFCWWCGCGQRAPAEVALFFLSTYAITADCNIRTLLPVDRRDGFLINLLPRWLFIRRRHRISPMDLIGHLYPSETSSLSAIVVSSSIRHLISPQGYSIESSCEQKPQGTATNIIIIFTLTIIFELRPRTLHSILGSSLYYIKKNPFRR